MQLSHAVTAVDVVFDEPNLITDAGWWRRWRWPSRSGCSLTASLRGNHGTLRLSPKAARDRGSAKIAELDHEEPGVTVYRVEAVKAGCGMAGAGVVSENTVSSAGATTRGRRPRGASETSPPSQIAERIDNTRARIRTGCLP